MPTSLEYILTKKAVLAGLQCHKRLWWQLHEPAAPELDVSLVDEYRMEEGRRVGALARSAVPGGHLVAIADGGPAAQVTATAALLARADVSAIYEGAFVANETFVATDILERSPDTPDAWTLIEVKGTSSVSADEHLPDVAVQAWVLRACGVRVARYEVMHLNRDCRHPDFTNLFVREDVTEQVRPLLDAVGAEIDAQRRVARAPSPPDVAIGDHCGRKRDGECSFLARCWPALPSDHVTTLYRGGAANAKKWIASGWETIPALPDSVKLSAIAARQRRSLRQGAMIVEREALARALDAVARPVAHIDFETVGPAVPVWPGCRPFDQVPVQLSCHVVGVDGTQRHVEWLFDGDGDPRPPAARAILDACRGARTVTAYYASFEKACIHLVADACPEEAAELRAIADGIVDLLPIVREHVYHPAFGGSFSLKAVLPALVPDLTYEGFEIAEGQTAQVTLTRLLLEPERMGDDERRERRAQLLRYCKRDTEAMVALEDKLREYAAG